MQRDHWQSLALLFLWIAGALWMRWDQWAPDLAALYFAGWHIQMGLPDLAYASPPMFFGDMAEIWADALSFVLPAAQGNPPEVFAYVYPPIWAQLVAPLTQWLSPTQFFNAFSVVQIPALAGCSVLAGRLVKPSSLSWTVWTLVSVITLTVTVPAISILHHNQPTILVGLLILLSFERLAARAHWSAGAALALAAAVKLSPALLVILLLHARAWRAVFSFALFGGGLALASVALAGWPLHAAFLEAGAKLSDWTLISANNLSLSAAWQSLTYLFDPVATAEIGQTHSVIIPAQSWARHALSLLAVLALCALPRLFRHLPQTAPDHLRYGLWLFAGLVIVNLFGPLGWLHYYVLPLLMLPGLYMTAVNLRSVSIFLCTTLLLSPLPFVAASSDIGSVAVYVLLLCLFWLGVLATALRKTHCAEATAELR